MSLSAQCVAGVPLPQQQVMLKFRMDRTVATRRLFPALHIPAVSLSPVHFDQCIHQCMEPLSPVPPFVAGVPLAQQQVVLEFRMDRTVATQDEAPVVLGRMPESFVQQLGCGGRGPSIVVVFVRKGR